MARSQRLGCAGIRSHVQLGGWLSNSLDVRWRATVVLHPLGARDLVINSCPCIRASPHFHMFGSTILTNSMYVMTRKSRGRSIWTLASCTSNADKRMPNLFGARCRDQRRQRFRNTLQSNWNGCCLVRFQTGLGAVAGVDRYAYPRSWHRAHAVATPAMPPGAHAPGHTRSTCTQSVEMRSETSSYSPKTCSCCSRCC